MKLALLWLSLACAPTKEAEPQATPDDSALTDDSSDDTGVHSDSGPDTHDTSGDTGDDTADGSCVIASLEDAYATAYVLGSGAGIGLPLVAGDLNGDGQADLVSGVPGVHVLPGPFGPGSVDALAWRSAYLWDDSGAPGSAIAVGDTNGDGLEDLALGDEFGDRLFLVYGPIEGDYPLRTASDRYVYSSYALQTRFGAATSLAGDFDADGRRDLIVADPDAVGDEGYNIGHVYILTDTSRSAGVVTADRDAALVLAGEPDQAIGSDLGAADLDGDGVDDLAFTTAKPSLRILLDPLGAQDWAEFTTDAPNWRIELGADFTGDGVGDVLFASPSAVPGAAETTGVVFVLPGPPEAGRPEDRAVLTLYSSTSTTDFAAAASAGLDFTRDGTPDIVVSDVDQDGIGTIHLIPGRASGVIDADTEGWRVAGRQAGDVAGRAIVAGPDWTGDGIGDIAVGAPGDTPEGYRGVVYLLCGDWPG